jgi:hypothetical protein
MPSHGIQKFSAFCWSAWGQVCSGEILQSETQEYREAAGSWEQYLNDTPVTSTKTGLPSIFHQLLDTPGKRFQNHSGFLSNVAGVGHFWSQGGIYTTWTFRLHQLPAESCAGPASWGSAELLPWSLAETIKIQREVPVWTVGLEDLRITQDCCLPCPLPVRWPATPLLPSCCYPVASLLGFLISTCITQALNEFWTVLGTGERSWRMFQRWGAHGLDECHSAQGTCWDAVPSHDRFLSAVREPGQTWGFVCNPYSHASVCIEL